MTILYSNIFNTLDLHGETLEVAMYLVKGFISDNIKMKNEYIAIIHGNGEVLKSNLLKYLKKSLFFLLFQLLNKHQRVYIQAFQT